MNHEIKAAELRIALIQTQQELLHYKMMFAQQELNRLRESEKTEKAKRKTKAKQETKQEAENGTATE